MSTFTGGLAELIKPWDEDEEEADTAVPNPRKWYEVYEVANGFVARLRSGQLVVGKTMTEVASEAHALITQELTEQEIPPVPPPKTR